MWGLPGSEIKPVSPALAGGFFTEPPGKPWLNHLSIKTAVKMGKYLYTLKHTVFINLMLSCALVVYNIASMWNLEK